MSRYTLMKQEDHKSEKVEILTATPKADMKAWFEENINSRGLDWRAGFVIKFRDSYNIFTWVHTNTGLTVKS